MSCECSGPSAAGRARTRSPARMCSSDSLVRGSCRMGRLRTMGRPRIVFALANPDPEIDPLDAAPDVDVLATGRSDYPNQVNNVLAFPGVFRGLLDARARGVSAEVELAAAKALAATVPPQVRSAEYILPSVFDRDVVPAVANAVAAATRDAGLARKTTTAEA